MKLLIMHMPGRASKQELKRFIESRARRLFGFLPFVSKPFLRQCEIICVEDKRKQTMEYHGLVTIEPAKACQSMIKRLNGRRFKGIPLIVRPYIKRSYYKDRRRKHADLERLPVERRMQDRRRPEIYRRRSGCDHLKYR